MAEAANWRKFEKAVADIQALFTPNAEIKRNERLVDRLGHLREFDVVIEDSWSGQRLLGVIECRDLNRKVGTPQVEAFKEKSEKVRANFKAIVSTKGFSKPALEAAKHYGIGTMSLLPKDPEVAGFALYWPAYAEVWRWTKVKLEVIRADTSVDLGKFTAFGVKHEGKSVFAWFLKKLKEEYLHTEKKGVLRLTTKFDEPVQLTIEGKCYEVDEVVFEALREQKKRHKLLKVTGDAFYDWQEKILKWPNKGVLVSEVIDMHGIDEWEEYEGEFPKLVKDGEELEPNEVRLQFFFKFFGDVPEFEEEIADIEQL